MSTHSGHLDRDAVAGSKPTQLNGILLADLVDTLPDAVICLDAQQRIALFNEAAERTFGWTSGEVMGKPLEILMPERVRRIHGAYVERFREASERARKMDKRRRIAGLRKNGEEFPAEIGIAKVRMGDSIVFGAVLRDVTEQVKRQRRLQRAVRARDDALGVVAHDLRNPLSLVAMLSGALLQRADIDQLQTGVSKPLRLIHDAALQMDRLIQDLLDVTLVEAGRMTVDQRPVTALALCAGALATLRPIVEGAGIELVIDVPATLPMVRADPERIWQVFSNLIGNAIRFTPRGGTITVAAIEEGSSVRLTVSDTGTGISEEQIPHVFERFWQGSRTTKRSRAGLGLPIARGIVRAHGGELDVKSRVGVGSTFSFTLPSIAEPEPARRHSFA